MTLSRALLRRLWPQPIGNQCLLMLGAGVLFGLLAPAQTPWLQPLATIFLQASQIVVMPFLICELIVGFGRLRPGSLGELARRGGVVLMGLWIAASVVVVMLPLALPPLVTSEFFDTGLFETNEPTDLLTTYLPNNNFGALAGANFPAVVLFSCLLGILLQGIDERDHLLAPLGVMRTVFGKLNSLVVRLIPFGIFALIALNVAKLNVEQLIRIQGFLALSVIAFLVLSVGCTVAVLALTPLSPLVLWRIVRGPLALTASSANLLIALPMLVRNLQDELPSQLGPRANPARLADMGEELAPLVSLGFALPNLGQVAALIFIPFSAWYVDRALEPANTAAMLLSAIPTSVSGLKAVIRQELLHLGLPIDLLQLVYINGEWVYRLEKVLSLEGLVVLAVLVYARGVGAWQPKPLKALTGLSLAVALGTGLGWGSRISLATALEGSYRNDQRLLALTTARSGREPIEMRGVQTAQPVSLSAIKARGTLRVGLRSDGLPWAYRNNHGDLVGFDVDLLKSLATNLGVLLQLQEAPIAKLEARLSLGQLDLVAGGIQTSPGRAIRHELSRSYLTVNLGLVVADQKVKALQGGAVHPQLQPIRLAVRDAEMISPGLESQIARRLGDGRNRARVEFIPIDSKDEFFSKAGQQRFDGLLTPAESGASWAVLNPGTSLVTPFRDDLSNELVLMIGGRDATFRRYLNGWLAREQAQGRIDELFNYWILMKDEAAPALPG